MSCTGMSHTYQFVSHQAVPDEDRVTDQGLETAMISVMFTLMFTPCVQTHVDTFFTYYRIPSDWSGRCSRRQSCYVCACFHPDVHPDVHAFMSTFVIRQGPDARSLLKASEWLPKLAVHCEGKQAWMLGGTVSAQLSMAPPQSLICFLCKGGGRRR